MLGDTVRPRAYLQLSNFSTELVDLGLVGRLEDRCNAIGVLNEAFHEACISGVVCCMLERTLASWGHSSNGCRKAAMRGGALGEE